ncbi:hypothetical protein T440DRAFT_145439 [Plenodomus tracheiphilus IPT5]|uniref:Ig-like domain-containing protein n=1 Tax=Plenodomus tracheiphilus IPT5 TaxID=1408161 RepID=A0A6A7B0L7_9PLEO|nr:hypothetical protein T440DRAFT_145439 [Plenodomus tracheiphilus IPT5]
MMHRPTVFALLYLSIGARALTYWVEDQCGDKGVDESVMDEVRSMGVEGSKRLRDDGNENMAYSFKTIFKVERSDEAVRSQALTAFDIIAAMTKTDQREPSDIRIYCDEDNDQSGDANARWTKASPNTNKRRTREMAQYIDKHNKVLRAIGSYGCADVDEGDKFTLAQTYRWKEDPDTVAATQNPNRETITVSLCTPIRADQRVLMNLRFVMRASFSRKLRNYSKTSTNRTRGSFSYQ